MNRPVRLSVGLTAAALALTGIAAPAAALEGDPTDLIISEVVEGSSNNKAIELFNPTGAAVDLSAAQYSIQMFFNGSASAGLTINLTGSVAAGEAWVIAQASASAPVLAQADQTNGAGWFNGDDALTLRRAGTVVDSFGQIGVDPGTEWGAGLTSTADNTLRRADGVCVGDAVTNDAFDPALEWVGFATDTFDGLGTHTGCAEAPPQTPVINEFSASTAGTDIEYVELLVEPGTDVGGYRVLEIEGDAGASMGVVDEVVPFAAPDDDGRALAWLPANALENGTVSLLLVTGFAGALGDDLDADDDGAIDAVAGLEVLDSVAVNDGGSGDLAYGDTVLGVAFDGAAFALGGASRIPDGADTDSTADWVRNDFDKAGIPGNTGTLVAGEAANTPGVRNSLTVVVVPLPPADCAAAPVTIGSVQGAGATSPKVGASVEIEGVVIGDFQVGGFDGYYVQDAGDGDPATSDGIFVYAPTGLDVAAGDVVHLAGTVSEYFGMTELTATANSICASGAELPAPAEFSLPAGAEARERLEGMRVVLPQQLAILEYFEYGRYGTITLGPDRQMQPTALFDAGSPEAIALAEQNALNRIGVDDGRSVENPDPAIHPNGQVFTLENTFRGGDLVTDVTGVLDYRFDTWAVQPTQGADFAVANPRTAAPEVDGSTTVASFNVLNYFTTLGSRGASDPVEFERQQAKIVSAISQLDADIVGLIEIENNGDVAVASLVDALNDEMGAGTYAYIPTGVLGTDVITTALIYKPAAVAPLGEHAVLDESVDPRWIDDLNRPALAQAFTDLQTDGDVAVVVNHLKSKGSACPGEPEDPNGQGNCNVVRTHAAEAMVDWLATGPTAAEPGRELIIGDLNSYDHEDPIQVLTGAGYTDLLLRDQGEEHYSYVFDGQLGYLDYALAGPALAADALEATTWAINADEPSLIDYDMTFKKPAQDAFYAPDAYRSSDHDPVLVGLELDHTAPELQVTAVPASIFPPDAKWHTVDFDIDASDNSGREVTVELTGVEVEGHKAEYRVVSDTRIEVRARQGAVYTVTFEATDVAGNTTTAEVTVRITP
ncbi:ExeM/NucH family extracellular endonuclease [Agromyces aurantiacus]|uniref:ExeM/NucH family extracellular endonuclease n=1 Tax=Agromyces aurantiacus TaxID=165814 RepID=A0ABV9R1N8_9MICO|nr:ExeM/NucH family extracellular endonuclease [Agromyces aurantiacus]MBM7502704.1 putative extracellular nuclease [Agromyces aurantiacus]